MLYKLLEFFVIDFVKLVYPVEMNNLYELVC